MVLLSSLYYLMGFFSLFAIPSYKHFLLVHLFLLLTFYFTLLFMFYRIDKIRLSRIDLIMLILALLFYNASMIGAITSNVISGLTFSQIFIIVFLLFLFASKINIKLIQSYLKGFISSSMITSLYMVIQTIFFYLYKTNINEELFPENLLAKAGGHTLTNFISMNGVILFRATGFSWDPAITATALVFAFILINENIVIIKKLKFITLSILFLGIVLSISKVSILTLFIYLLIKLMRLHKIKIIFETDKKYKINSLSLVAIISFFFLLYIGFFFSYESWEEGNIRHLKYFSSLFYYPYQNIIEFLFGYGYRGSGEFFNKCVDWFNTVPGFYFKIGQTPESTLTQVFLIGGLLGSIFWIFTYIYSFFKANKEIKTMLLVLLLITFGNTVNSVWFITLYSSILFMSIRGRNENLH
jgi:hypothetical protein